MDRRNVVSRHSCEASGLEIGLLRRGNLDMRHRICLVGRWGGRGHSVAAFSSRTGLPTLCHLILSMVLLMSSVTVAALSNPVGAGQRAFLPLKPHQLARAAANTSAVLRNFEVDPPIYTPSSAPCQQILMMYSFGNSYGQPFVGQ